MKYETRRILDGRVIRPALPRALSEARTLLADFIAEINAHGMPPEPIQTIEGVRETIELWHVGRDLRIHTVEGQCGVFIARRRDDGPQVLPDWSPLTSDEARSMGLALIAAANRSELGEGGKP